MKSDCSFLAGRAFWVPASCPKAPCLREAKGGAVLDIAYVVQTAVWQGDKIDNATGDSMTDRRHQAVRRDGYTCQGCGCRSAVTAKDLWCGLEVHHLDGSERNNKEDNLVTVCPLCHGILHFDIMLKEGKMPGRFLWTDAIAQPELNMATHVLAVLETLCRDLENDPRAGEEGLKTAQKLRARCRKAAAGLNELAVPKGAPFWGDKEAALSLTDDPAAFGSALGEFLRQNPAAKERDAVAARLRPLRWLYDWRADLKASCYAAAPIWNRDGEWPGEWAAEAKKVLLALEGRLPEKRM